MCVRNTTGNAEEPRWKFSGNDTRKKRSPPRYTDAAEQTVYAVCLVDDSEQELAVATARIQATSGEKTAIALTAITSRDRITIMDSMAACRNFKGGEWQKWILGS